MHQSNTIGRQSEGQCTTGVQLSGEGLSRQRSAEARRKRNHAAADMAKQHSASDELLHAVEVASKQASAEQAALAPPAQARLRAAADMERQPSADSIAVRRPLHQLSSL